MKQKIDMLIKGNLIADANISKLGGGEIFLQISNKEKDYDITSAIVVNGDVHVSSFETGSKTILVCGYVTAFGKEDGDGK